MFFAVVFVCAGLFGISRAHEPESIPQHITTTVCTTATPANTWITSSPYQPATASRSGSISFEDAVAYAAAISSTLQTFDGHGVLPVPSNNSLPAGVGLLAGSGPHQQSFEGISDTVNITAMIQALLPGYDGVIPQSIEKRQSGMRVMIVGDSMTEGQQGDITWRYHMWTWFRDQGLTVDFVGPYSVC